MLDQRLHIILAFQIHICLTSPFSLRPTGVDYLVSNINAFNVIALSLRALRVPQGKLPMGSAAISFFTMRLLHRPAVGFAECQTPRNDVLIIAFLLVTFIREVLHVRC